MYDTLDNDMKNRVLGYLQALNRGERTAISEHEMKIVEVVVTYRDLEWDDEIQYSCLLAHCVNPTWRAGRHLYTIKMVQYAHIIQLLLLSLVSLRI